MKKCDEIGCDNPVFGKNKCRYHYPKKPLKKSGKIAKQSIKGKEKAEEKKEYTKKQWELFLEIWAERKHFCYESGQFLGYEPLSTMFHHVLPKGIKKYKKYALEKWNIILLDPFIHQLVETNIDKCPKIKAYTQELKEKYDI